MSEFCFWILNDGGSIMKPDARHILAVSSCPEPFGESLSSLQETFDRHGEHMHSNVEAVARQEVLRRVIDRNHIRIRKNVQRRSQNWSLQLYKLTDERKKAISVWATYISPNTDDKFADVIIHQFHDRSVTIVSLDSLVIFETENISKIRVYKQEELQLLDHWVEYAHTLAPKSLSPKALKEIDLIRKEINIEEVLT